MIGFRSKTSHTAQLVASVAKGIFDRIGTQQVAVKRVRHVQRLQRDQILPGLAQTLERLCVLAFEELLQLLNNLFSGILALDLAKAFEKTRQFAPVLPSTTVALV